MTHDNSALAQELEAALRTCKMTGQVYRLVETAAKALRAQPATALGEIGGVICELRTLATSSTAMGHTMQRAADMLERLAGPVQQPEDQVAEVGMALCESALGGKRCPCRESGVFNCADEFPGQQARAAIAAMQTTPPAERVRHKKRGTTYTIVGNAELQLSFDDLCDGSEMIVYRGDDGKLWVRNANEFWDGRFERLSTSAYQGEGDGR